MIADAMRDVSDRNDIVIDPFCGSGTTIIAAEKTGRRAHTIELDPKYVDVAVWRWEKWSGKMARHAELTGSPAESGGKVPWENALGHDLTRYFRMRVCSIICLEAIICSCSHLSNFTVRREGVACD
jgi:hypothetical protein